MWYKNDKVIVNRPTHSVSKLAVCLLSVLLLYLLYVLTVASGEQAPKSKMTDHSVSEPALLDSETKSTFAQQDPHETVAHDQDLETKSPPRKTTSPNKQTYELEALTVEVNELKQKVAVYEELLGLKEQASIFSSGYFYLAELNRSLDDVTMSDVYELCVHSLSLFNSSNLTHGGGEVERKMRKIKRGDLVVAQGALLGEISSINGECYGVIPTWSGLSSFEVRLEKSGIGGVAVGLGKDRSSLKQRTLNSGSSEASMRIKYLERSRPALIGERALLIRKSSKTLITDKNVVASSVLKKRQPTFTVGEVIKSDIDENGLFQSALLASPLSTADINFVIIYSVD